MTTDKATEKATEKATRIIAAGLVIPGGYVVLDGKRWLVVDGSTGDRTRTLTLVRNTTTRTIRRRRTSQLNHTRLPDHQMPSLVYCYDATAPGHHRRPITITAADQKAAGRAARRACRRARADR